MRLPDGVMDAIDLRLDRLQDLRVDIARPAYDRATLTPGILHIGVGNFHRAHQAIYLDRLFNLGTDLDWAIVGAGVRPADDQARRRLAAQDWLTTVIELEPTGLTARVTGAMIDFVPNDPHALAAAIARPDIRILSLTVTEGGYFIDAATGGVDLDHPDIRHDIANPDNPRALFGIITAGLAERHRLGHGGLTIMSCDNIQGNGAITRQVTMTHAAGRTDGLANWIAGNVSFPNGMVDCITPATGERERDLVRTQFGIADDIPVVCEPFRQWVLEDHFTAGRPALERVGVEFVSDVAPFEAMKLRILNGGHAAIAYAGALLGHTYAHEAMQNGLIRDFLTRLERQEIIPTVRSIPGVDFDLYLETIIERFGNPRVGDTIARLATDGSNRQPKFILPTIADRLENGLPVDGLALEVALWCRACAGVMEDGNLFTPSDVAADRLMAEARQAETDPDAFLRLRDIFGTLGDNPVFTAAFRDALAALRRNGVVATLATYAAGGAI